MWTLDIGLRRAIMLLIAAGALSACASHPKPLLAAAPPPSSQLPPPPLTSASIPPPAPVSSAPLPGSERDFVVNVGDRVYFDYDQRALRADAEPLLAAQATWLVRYPAVKVRLEGNCDERGTEEYNLALGARRANAVRDFLVSHGVLAGRLATVSYGKERPIDSGSGEAALQHNRNTQTAILSGTR